MNPRPQRTTPLLLTAALLAALLPGCLTPVELTSGGASVQVADENIVKSCKYLGDVTGRGTSDDDARRAAQNDAAAQGATHIVFVSETPLTATLAATSMGRAYDCSATEASHVSSSR
ncbi:MAG TPA: DUF4156 domain-containing protein [Polyangiaceae bacterium]|jgi:hypothetical protein